MSINVRNAKMDDVASIVRMGRNFYKESNFEDGGYDAEEFSNILRGQISSDKFIVLIAEEAGIKLGFMIVEICKPYTIYKVAMTFLFYVDKNARTFNAGRKILDKADEERKKAGAKYFYVSSSAGFDDAGRNEKVLRAMYFKKGFSGNGFFMRKE